MNKNMATLKQLGYLKVGENTESVFEYIDKDIIEDSIEDIFRFLFFIVLKVNVKKYKVGYSLTYVDNETKDVVDSFCYEFLTDVGHFKIFINKELHVHTFVVDSDVFMISAKEDICEPIKNKVRGYLHESVMKKYDLIFLLNNQ